MKVLVTQSCPTLWNPMDCRPPGSSVQRNIGFGNKEPIMLKKMIIYIF